MPRFKAALLVVVVMPSILVGCTILDRLSKDSDPVVDDASIDRPFSEGGSDAATSEASSGNDAATADGAVVTEAGVDASDGATSDAAGSDAGSQDATADGDAG